MGLFSWLFGSEQESYSKTIERRRRREQSSGGDGYVPYTPFVDGSYSAPSCDSGSASCDAGGGGGCDGGGGGGC